MRETAESTGDTASAPPTPRPLPRQRHLEELLLRAVEYEQLTARVYRAALGCVHDDATRRAWLGRLRRTDRNMAIAAKLCRELQIGADRQLWDCAAVRRLAAALVAAIETAKQEGVAERMDSVARECVTIAESKTRLDWDRFMSSMSAEPSAIEVGSA